MTDLINLYHQAEDYFFRGISSKCLPLGDGANAYMIGVPVADLNLVYVTQNTNALDKMLSQGKQFYDQDSLSFVIIVAQELCSPETEQRFALWGLLYIHVTDVCLIILTKWSLLSDIAIFDNNDTSYHHS